MASFPSPIPFPSLPSLFAPGADLSAPDPIAESQIRNTLATYTFSIDSKNFTALSSVFHPDAVANYSEPINVISGLPEITATLEASLALFAGTQHNYGTQAIRVYDEGACARAVTYYTAAHFGKGEAEGQVLYAYGQYQDLLTPSEQGQWLIKERNLVYMGPFVGNLSAFVGTS
ncbi:hypothetical protein INS49_010023 [Diaporthe citri]|uniref:uncharacterized protein n=1 Tax=Diaporthe citri TaxID=83186 RepID=UPI001C8230AC|nr:uncharacterized protein INS49_010023 [Diaporthe citri]KAG6361794.1 hypothetical protein INS49_010023 [Diaporthe citri]